ncbi:MAG: DUF3604 domain-containing protein [Pseudomonadota bacterium]
MKPVPARAGAPTMLILLTVLLGACSKAPAPKTSEAGPGGGGDAEPLEAPREVTDAARAAGTTAAANPDRNAYFGDLHVHTHYSFDAYLFGTRATPDDAYAYARGNGIEHAAGFEMKLPRPLDFQAVTDHGSYLGMLPAMFTAGSGAYDHPLAKGLREAEGPVARREAFNSMLPRIGGLLEEEDDLLDAAVVRSAWIDIVESAERNNDPGEFTTFIGYEYTTGGPNFENLHRNVIFAGSKRPELPFTRLDSVNPEELWDWLDGLREQGIEGLAIPHHPNGSDGWMFQQTDWAGAPIDATYAEQRMRNEPLVENTQVKGTSDTHPLLSPNDEWADFEIMPLRVASDLASKASGSYVREAYLNGLAMQAEQGFNPYRFGVIGSSDTHNAAGSFEEHNYFSKTGLLDATPQLRGSVPMNEPGQDGSRYRTTAANFWGASGLAGVWAEENTRASLYAAMRRKETFSTSGPFIRVRFFAGYGLEDSLLAAANPIPTLYASASTMGSELAAAAGGSPSFFVWAARDANSMALARLQIIKGWVGADGAQEQVFDIACSDGLTVDPQTQRCPDNGAGVDLDTCQPLAGEGAGSGAAELKTLWQDPNFDPGQHAFYYVRVLENPSCRWSSWDALRSGVPVRPDMKATIQERAWSSPIWITPLS